MHVDIDSLRCFDAAATHLNFRAAAQRVHLSPAAFSERIKRLEEQLGVRLFDRTTRRVALTAAGRRLVDPARRCLDASRRCVEAAREEGRTPPFSLVVGTRFELGLSWLVPALESLKAARPERRLNLYFGDSADLLRRVQRGSIDAMISSVRLTDAGLAYTRLHEERYVMVGAPALLDTTPLGGPDDARQHVLLDIHGDLPLFRYFLDARPRSEAWSFADTELLGTIGAVRLRALAGAGVAVLPRYFVTPDLEARELISPLPEVEPVADAFRLVWREDHALSAELRLLADELSAYPLR